MTEERESSPAWHAIVIVLVLFLGIGASVVGGREIGKQADEERLARAHHQATQFTTEFDRALGQTETTLRALAALFYSSEEVTATELRRAAEISQGPDAIYNFEALGFVVRVDGEDRERYERSAGQNLRTLKAATVPADRYEHFPVTMSTNEELLAPHADLASSQAARTAVASAFLLPGTVYMGPSFYLESDWWALMSIGAPSQKQDGVLVGLLNVSKLFNRVSADIPEGLEVHLHQETMVWESSSIQPQLLGLEAFSDSDAETFSLDLERGRGRLSLHWAILPSFEEGTGKQLSRVLILGGSLLSLTVALLLAVLLAQNARVRNHVRQRTEELAKARDEAETANRTKTEFLANMSHELRTPLNAILGFSEIIRDQVLGPEARERYQEYAQDIHRSGAHLLEIITDILDIAKAEEGKLDLVEDNFALERLMDGVKQLMRERALAEGVTLTMDCAPDVPALFADGRRVKQILINLLSNAIKFTPEGGRVTLSSRLREDGGVRIQVSDTGIGMTEADIPTALKPFGQVDSKLSRKFDGTGLGLPISRHLAELHGATLSVESQPGEGTTITLDFPVARSVKLENVA